MLLIIYVDVDVHVEGDVDESFARCFPLRNKHIILILQRLKDAQPNVGVLTWEEIFKQNVWIGHQTYFKQFLEKQQHCKCS